MKSIKYILLMTFLIGACKNNVELSYEQPDAKVLFLHHSTGMNVYMGKREFLSHISKRFEHYSVPAMLQEYNEKHSVKYSIKEQTFPAGDPYPWNNYPYDYYNIWVKNAGDKAYMDEPTLEMLTPEYDVIVFKHCFPVSNILENDSVPDINSEKKTIANYKLQYEALKQKLHEFPETKFIVWTGASLTKEATTEENALRASEFFNWVVNVWGVEDDNIYVWDLRKLQTDDNGLYLSDSKAKNAWDSHLNSDFSELVAREFVNKIISVIEIKK
jgi:hypothetical protein